MPSPRSRLLALTLCAATAVGAVACGDREGPPRAPRDGATATPGPDVRFEERAVAAGLVFRTTFLEAEQGERFKVNLYDHGSGVAVADVDADGDDDVYLVNQLGTCGLFANDGHGQFTDVTARAGVGLGDRIGVSATFADADGDGDQDLYVTSTRGGDVYFRNRGDGTFEDATQAAGLALVAHAQAATFFDADGDGDLDLLVACTAQWTTQAFDATTRHWTGVETLAQVQRSPVERNHYYRNRGDGSFEDATDDAGLAGAGWASDFAIFDADDDGDLDVYVARMFDGCALFVNDGTGRFVDRTLPMLGRTSKGAVGARVLDADGDGRLDLLTVDMHSDMWMDPSFDPTASPATFRQAPRGPGGADGSFGDPAVHGSTLHVNRGGGKYAEIGDLAGIDTLWPWGAVVGDFDLDGAEDVFVPSGMGYPFAYWHSPLLMNAGRTFVDAARRAGLDPPPEGTLQPATIGGRPATTSARAAATADFDGDGRLDLVVSQFNGRALLYLNRSPARAWVGLRLVGAGKNRDAIGALVRLRVRGKTLVRQVQAAGGYLSQSGATILVGLGDAASIDGCEIRWPDGTTEAVDGLVAGRVHRIEERGGRRPR